MPNLIDAITGNVATEQADPLVKVDAQVAKSDVVNTGLDIAKQNAQKRLSLTNRKKELETKISNLTSQRKELETRLASTKPISDEEVMRIASTLNVEDVATNWLNARSGRQNREFEKSKYSIAERESINTGRTNAEDNLLQQQKVVALLQQKVKDSPLADKPSNKIELNAAMEQLSRMDNAYKDKYGESFIGSNNSSKDTSADTTNNIGSVDTSKNTTGNTEKIEQWNWRIDTSTLKPTDLQQLKIDSEKTKEAIQYVKENGGYKKVITALTEGLKADPKYYVDIETKLTNAKEDEKKRIESEVQNNATKDENVTNARNLLKGYYAAKKLAIDDRLTDTPDYKALLTEISKQEAIVKANGGKL